MRTNEVKMDKMTIIITIMLIIILIYIGYEVSQHMNVVGQQYYDKYGYYPNVTS